MWVEKKGLSPERIIVQLIRDTMGVDEDQVKMNFHFMSDLGADSLQLAQLLKLVEEEFHIDIPVMDAEKMHSVQDVVDFVEEKVGQV